MNSIDLKDKRAIVTGAAGGIGRGVAGAACGFRRKRRALGPDMARLTAARDARAGLVGAHVSAVDVTDIKAVEAAMEETAQRLGGLEILINCAGIVGLQCLA